MTLSEALKRSCETLSDAMSQRVVRRGIYIASKTRHADRWRSLRASGYPITSTWIDEAGEGETKCHGNLWHRCITEASHAAVTILYSEPGDVLNGALIEVGAALGAGRPVYVVGEGPSLKTFLNHRMVFRFDSISAALRQAMLLLVN